ncbi:MAG TPA: chromate transporter [Clostridiales bacterium]|nr:chromate transporter [Clostridiales bacterium]
MTVNSKGKRLGGIFLSMLKIGAFTFGGGYAMVALLENEFVSKKGWMRKEEFLDLVAIAESTPGPLAVNSATYIGYRVAGIAGAALGTLAVCLPSFFVILLISLFFDRFLSLRYVGYAFRGIRVAVIYLIASAGLKMLKSMKKTPMSVAICALSMGALIALTLTAVNFSSVFLILAGGAVGVIVWLIARARKRGGDA